MLPFRQELLKISLKSIDSYQFCDIGSGTEAKADFKFRVTRSQIFLVSGLQSCKTNQEHLILRSFKNLIYSTMKH